LTKFQLGDVTVIRVEEVLEPGFEPSFLFPGFDPALRERYPLLAQPSFFHSETGKLISSVHTWLIRLQGKTILVDTCSGNGKARALPLFRRFHMLDLPYLDNLRAVGVNPEDVDLVFCTHLHIDHVGWNTQAKDGKWVATFPNARYLFGRAEYEHWCEGGAGRALLPENVDVIRDSVDPVVEAGLVDLVEDGDEILPGLKAVAAPGHTKTQLNLVYDRGGARFVCSADVMAHPLQIYAPELNGRFDEDHDTARATRWRLLEYCAESGALLLPSHFGPPHAGFVERRPGGFAFKPAEDTLVQ
jgi:glyoxylase-like metal-dependent hydrolase (beta-lactamase superfamily II)